MFNVKTLSSGHVYLSVSYYFTFSVSTLVSFLSLLIENRLFSHTMTPQHSFSSLHYSQPPLPLSLRSFPTLFPLQKWSLLQQRAKQEKTRRNMRRQKSSCGSWTRPPNRSKESQEQAKELETRLLPLLGSHNETPSYQPYHISRKPGVDPCGSHGLWLLLLSPGAHMSPDSGLSLIQLFMIS